MSATAGGDKTTNAALKDQIAELRAITAAADEKAAERSADLKRQIAEFKAVTSTEMQHNGDLKRQIAEYKAATLDTNKEAEKRNACLKQEIAKWKAGAGTSGAATKKSDTKNSHALGEMNAAPEASSRNNDVKEGATEVATEQPDAEPTSPTSKQSKKNKKNKKHRDG